MQGMRKLLPCWVFLAFCLSLSTGAGLAAPSACAPYLASANTAKEPIEAENLLRLTVRQCPAWAAGRRALAQHYLMAAAKQKSPNRAQALLHLSSRQLGLAHQLDPKDPSLAALARGVREREAALTATAGAAPLSAREIAVLLAPGRGAPPPLAAPLAAPRLDFPNVRFSAGTARLEPSSTGQLDELGRALRFLLPRIKVLLAGHTDRAGELESNLKLSRQRADAVKNYLVERWQIAPHRLQSTGLGYSAPLAGLSPFDPTNRRMEVRALP